MNGLFDCLYITKETESAPTMDCPDEWDFNTIFHADFNNTTSAGNVDWNLKTVSHILIKRRDVSDFKWMTIIVKEIHSLDDFKKGIVTNDYFNSSNVQYEYALVPSLYGTEGNYNTITVDSVFNSVFVAEKNMIIGTPAADGFCDTVRNTLQAYSNTQNKYATGHRGTKANYDTGSCKGNFMELNEDDCSFQTDDRDRVKYQKKILDFLANGSPKLLKNFDGRTWLILVDDKISDTADGLYNNRIITFNWTEIGNYLSEKDLFYTNLSDVTEEWWNL